MTVQEFIDGLEIFDKNLDIVFLSNFGRILEIRGAKVERVFKGRHDDEGVLVCAILED